MYVLTYDDGYNPNVILKYKLGGFFMHLQLLFYRNAEYNYCPG